MSKLLLSHLSILIRPQALDAVLTLTPHHFPVSVYTIEVTSIPYSIFQWCEHDEFAMCWQLNIYEFTQYKEDFNVYT